jgi:hypothetical protein
MCSLWDHRGGGHEADIAPERVLVPVQPQDRRACAGLLLLDLHALQLVCASRIHTPPPFPTLLSWMLFLMLFKTCASFKDPAFHAQHPHPVTTPLSGDLVTHALHWCTFPGFPPVRSHFMLFAKCVPCGSPF